MSLTLTAGETVVKTHELTKGKRADSYIKFMTWKNLTVFIFVLNFSLCYSFLFSHFNLIFFVAQHLQINSFFILM